MTERLNWTDQRYGFSSCQVWMWELDYKESQMPKNWCLELWCWRRLLRVLWTIRWSNQWILKDMSWIFIGMTDAEAEAPILWPRVVKDWLIGKDPDAGKDWKQEEERDNRGWDGWMASPTQWTWVWASSGHWWWTGKPSMLQSMGSKRQTWRSDWTELKWTSLRLSAYFSAETLQATREGHNIL